MAERRSAAAAAVVAGKLYVCGGFDGDVRLRSAERFDPDGGAWEPLPPMAERRSRVTSATTPTGCAE